jgi:hypothetical protein
MEHLGVNALHHPDYMEFQVRGDIDKERFVNITKAISQQSIERQQHRLLMVYPDQSVAEGLDLMDQHKFAIHDASIIRQESDNRGATPAQIAVVVKPEVLASHRFFEKSLSSRGFAIQHFDDRQSALNWLL